MGLHPPVWQWKAEGCSTPLTRLLIPFPAQSLLGVFFSLLPEQRASGQHVALGKHKDYAIICAACLAAVPKGRVPRAFSASPSSMAPLPGWGHHTPPCAFCFSQDKRGLFLFTPNWNALKVFCSGDSLGLQQPRSSPPHSWQSYPSALQPMEWRV